jgi:hypothetical protein
MTANMLKCWGGQYGVTVIADTNAHASATGEVFGKLVAKGATVISALTGNWSANPGAIADGEAIFGKFTSVTLASGELYAYRMKTADV